MYESPWSLLRESMWSLMSPSVGRTNGAEKSRSCARGDFFNNICQKATSHRPLVRVISSRIGGVIRCGHLLKRLKSNGDFGCSHTVASDRIEHLPDFFQIWRFSAQPV